MRLVLLLALMAQVALAQADTALEAQKIQLEKLRGEIADQVQLRAYDLVDELVLSWKQRPPFELPTPVILAEVSVPVGFGSGLTSVIENHFLDVVLKNKDSHIMPAHCPACTAMVVHSGSKGTIVARGIDEPEALASAGIQTGSKHALFLDFEIEGAALILRARITSLEPSLPIVYAKTLSSTTSAAALLRSGEQLKTGEQARQEYLDALNGRGLFGVPVRLGMQTFGSPETQRMRSVPLIWLQSGLEMALTHARGWVASVLAGFTFAPQLHVGWSLHARFERLLGLSSSLTSPDIYIFVGGGMFAMYGVGALALRDRAPTPEEIATALTPGREPSVMIGAAQIGFEIRVRNRIGATLFLETTPYLDNAEAIGRIIDLGIIKFHSFGVEVCFWF